MIEVKEDRREEVRKQVMEELGPSDPTVVVTVCDTDKNCISVTELVDCLHKYGDIVLVR